MICELPVRLSFVSRPTQTYLQALTAAENDAQTAIEGSLGLAGDELNAPKQVSEQLSCRVSNGVNPRCRPLAG